MARATSRAMAVRARSSSALKGAARSAISTPSAPSRAPLSGIAALALGIEQRIGGARHQRGAEEAAHRSLALVVAERRAVAVQAHRASRRQHRAHRALARRQRAEEESLALGEALAQAHRRAVGRAEIDGDAVGMQRRLRHRQGALERALHLGDRGQRLALERGEQPLRTLALVGDRARLGGGDQAKLRAPAPRRRGPACAPRRARRPRRARAARPGARGRAQRRG